MVKRIFILFFFTFTASTSFSQTKEDYADYLMKNEDYFRAISVYKQLYFFSEDSAVKYSNLYNIMRAYHLSDKYEISNSYADHILKNYKGDNDMISNLYLYRGLNYYQQFLPDLAEDCFIKSKELGNNRLSNFYLGLIEIEKFNWQTAHNIYLDLTRNYTNENIGFLSNHLAGTSLDLQKINSKSPLLASVLSSIVPGLGQAYTGHYYDGLQAFLYVSITSFAAYASYRYDKNFNNNYVTTYISVPIAAIFYIANILGANLTANYYNLKQQQNYFDSFRKIVLSIEID
jgi:TM2 domain-containing membrane protein YozV